MLIDLTEEEIETIRGCLGNERGLIDIGMRPQAPDSADKCIASIDAVLSKLPETAAEKRE